MKRLPGGLVTRILVAVPLATLLGLLAPGVAGASGLLGTLFIGLLKAVAPLLVMMLVLSAIANRHERTGDGRRIALTLALYLVATLGAAAVALGFSLLFPVTLDLAQSIDGTPPQAVGAVLLDILLALVDNPVGALVDGNFLGCLSWGVVLGFAFRDAPAPLRDGVQALAEALGRVVRWIIALAPLGIFGLVAATVAGTGIDALARYAGLALRLAAAMVFVALVLNPLLAALVLRRNPYPVLWRCLRGSGLTAFFTRSSAANIPVNLALCGQLGISEELYSVTIPTGATVNMAGAAITITTLTLAATHTLGITPDWPSALLLCTVAALAACGASGVPSGSLLLVPLACGLFGISVDTAMQVVAVGFVVSVVQDSLETALNSSSDVFYSWVADQSSGAP